jgi:hypothetical protein
MPRQALAPAEIVDPAADLPAISAGLDAAADMHQRTQALAEQLRFDGATHPEALMDGIRSGIRRTAEECVAIGQRLALLREQTPHGEWMAALESVDLHPRLAQRLIAVAVRVAKSDSVSHLAKLAKNQSMLLEFIALDDEEADTLVDTGELNGLRLDDIERMSPSQARAELRKARQADNQRSAALEKILDDKNKKIDKLAEQLLAAEHGQRALDWGDEANKQLAAITVDAGKALQAMDRLSVAREAILTAKASDGEPVPDSALEAFATTYLDLLEQVWESAGTLLAEGEELLGGYRDIKRARLNQVALAADAAADADADAPTLQ